MGIPQKVTLLVFGSNGGDRLEHSKNSYYEALHETLVDIERACRIPVKFRIETPNAGACVGMLRDFASRNNLSFESCQVSTAITRVESEYYNAALVLYKPHGGVPLYLKPLLRAVKDNYLFRFVAVQDAYYGNGGT